VTALHPILELRDLVRGATYPLAPGRSALVGRRPGPGGAHILCEDPTVSGIHLEVHAVGQGTLRLVDRSSQGTYVNGHRIAGEGTARHGDRIQLGGGYSLIVVDPTAPPPPVPAPAIAQPPAYTPVGYQQAPANASQTAPVEGRLQPPPVIAGRYRVVRELAQGGMGVVFEAVDERPGGADPRRAIKILKTGRSTEEQQERFRREAMVAQRLGDHPGIVQVHDIGALPTGELFYVMDFVEGKSMWDVAQQGLDPTAAVRLVVQVARAVAHAHARDVIHRDLKPQNVIVSPAGQARLTDFGIAKALDDAQGLTVTGAVMGTPRFMPPEQAEDSKRVDARSDVFGLGGILYTCLTRRPPLDLSGFGTRDALRAILECKVTPPAQVEPRVDAALDAICRRALARRPEHRPATAQQVADELQGWLDGDRTVRAVVTGVTEEDDDGIDPGPGKALLVVLCLGVVLAAAIVAVAFLT